MGLCGGEGADQQEKLPHHPSWTVQRQVASGLLSEVILRVNAVKRRPLGSFVLSPLSLLPVYSDLTHLERAHRDAAEETLFPRRPGV